MFPVSVFFARSSLQLSCHYSEYIHHGSQVTVPFYQWFLGDFLHASSFGNLLCSTDFTSSVSSSIYEPIRSFSKHLPSLLTVTMQTGKARLQASVAPQGIECRKKQASKQPFCCELCPG